MTKGSGMRLPSRDTVERTGFVLSVALLTFVLGFATSEYEWFSGNVLEAGWEQFEAVKEAVFDDDHAATEPRAHDRQGARTVDAGAVQPGLTLVPSVWRAFDWNPGLRLIDLDGDVLHQWEVDPTRLFPEEFGGPLAAFNEFHQPHGAHLFPNGDVLVVLSRTGIVRLDACGAVRWRLTGNYHHSVARAEDGSFWVSGAKTPDRQPDPITGKESVMHDLLVHLSAEGEVLEEIDVFDVLRENERLARRHFQLRQPGDTHLNDVESLDPSMAADYPLFDAGDLLVSLKHLNVVFVLDPETLRVKWWVREPFVHQHDPDFVGDGWIGVFDNNEDGTERGTRFGGSRLLAFQPHTDSTEVWFESSDSLRLYTHNRGNWQHLENGNLLLTESTAGRVVEVSPDGELVWEWIHAPYDEARVPVVYWVERYDLSPERVSEWPCSPAEATGAEGG